MALGKKTGGRVKGTPNKRTVAKDSAVRAAIARLQVGSGSFAGDGYALFGAGFYCGAPPRARMRRIGVLTPFAGR